MKRKCICRGVIICALFLCSAGILSGCGKKNKVGNRTTATESVIPLPDSESTTTEELLTTTEDNVTTEEDVTVATDTSASDTTEALFVDNLASGPQVEYEEPIGEADSGVDVDLTVLTPNMIFAEVYNMMTNADDYIGKTVKLKGEYSPLFYDVTGNTYHYVIIKDALSCCENGIEFIWDDNTHVYPDEYPAEGQEIMVQGTYGSYVEEDFTYYYLEVDDVTILN